MTKVGGSKDFAKVNKVIASDSDVNIYGVYVDIVDDTPKVVNNKVSKSLYDVLPIGSVMAWAKTISGVPSLPNGWKECDGTLISDSGSPYNGANVPNLNGNNNFLRGAVTSGTTGGSATHTHSTSSHEGDDPGAEVITSIASASNLPPYYDVVFIIKIKDV